MWRYSDFEYRSQSAAGAKALCSTASGTVGSHGHYCWGQVCLDDFDGWPGSQVQRQLRPNIEGRGPEGEGPSKNVERGDHSNADGEAARARLDRD